MEDGNQGFHGEDLVLGGERAFSRFVAAYGARVQAIARQFLGSQADAEDVMQEVFVKAWQARRRFDSRRASVATWLYRITANTCLDRLRRRKRWRWLELEHIAEQADATVPGDERLEYREAAVAVRRDILGLPERQRMALLLVVLGERSAQEVADILGTTRGGAEQLLVRARQTLRERQRERER